MTEFVFFVGDDFLTHSPLFLIAQVPTRKDVFHRPRISQ